MVDSNLSRRSVMILAAGLGERMGSLTKNIPKPLLPVNGKPLILYLIERLKRQGFNHIVINCFWKMDKLQEVVGNGEKWGVNIQWSEENMPLETGGGILKALPLLGKEPFLLVNADVFIDIDFRLLQIPDDSLAHLIMVDNPEHNPEGDYVLDNNGVLFRYATTNQKKLTYSGVSLVSPDLFEGCKDGKFPLVDLLTSVANEQRLTGEYYPGYWLDVGTPERLSHLDSRLSLDN